MSKSENIKVVVRCRPMSDKEKLKGFETVVSVNSDNGTVQLLKNRGDAEPKTFPFNSAYPSDVTQQFIYDDCARPIVESVLEGYNGTIFAYGQTGTGKTYTMEGEVGDEKEKGIILHAFDHIFAHISSNKNREFLVRASFLQIYMEDVYDLLRDPEKKLHVRQVESDVTIAGLSSHIVKNPKEIIQLLVNGKKNRAVASTNMNAHSSRSHSVFTIVIEQHSEQIGTRMGKLHLVDLAGSEKLSKTEADGLTAKQAAKINYSLLQLGNVISALVTGKKHVSYRNSKLTQILQDSLGGNSKTCMVATIGPASYNYDETNSTLLYATRARDIKNIPRINEDPKDSLINQLRERIAELKKKLEEQKANGGEIVADNTELKEIESKYKKQIEELMARKNVNDEERRKAKAALEAEYERQKSLRNQTEDLAAKIKQMEQSVLIGGENLVDKAKQQEEILRAQESKMRRKKEEERRLLEKKKHQEEFLINAEKVYSSLQQEFDEKSKNIEKLRPIIKELEEKIDDIQEQYEREKEEQSKNFIEMNKEVSYLKMVCETFIPPDRLIRIQSHIHFDPVDNKPVCPSIELAGRHHKEEVEVYEEKIFIAGLDGSMELDTLVNIPRGPTAEEMKKAEEKRQKAFKDALSKMGVATHFDITDDD